MGYRPKTHQFPPIGMTNEPGVENANLLLVLQATDYSLDYKLVISMVWLYTGPKNMYASRLLIDQLILLRRMSTSKGMARWVSVSLEKQSDINIVLLVCVSIVMLLKPKFVSLKR